MVSRRWFGAVVLCVLASVGGCVVTAEERASIASDLRALGGVETVDVTHRSGDIMRLEYVGVSVGMRAGASAAQFREAAERMSEAVRLAQLVTPTSGTPAPAAALVSCVCVLRAEQSGRKVEFTLSRGDRSIDESGLATLTHDLLTDTDVQAATIDHSDGQHPPNATAHVRVIDSAAAGRVVASHGSAPGLRDLFVGPQRTPTDREYVVAGVPLTQSAAGTVSELLDLTTTVQPRRIPTVRVVSGLVDVTTSLDPAASTPSGGPTSAAPSPSSSRPPGTGPVQSDDPQGLCRVPAAEFAAGPIGTRLHAVLATMQAGTLLQFRPGGCQVNIRVVGPSQYEPAPPDPASGVDPTTALLATG
jgi:hypothetical protein